MPSGGEIAPGGTAKIEVQCFPEEAREYNELIFLHVTEPLKEYLHGKNISLHVTGSEPLMNFERTRDIFREQFYVHNIEQFTPPTFVCVYVLGQSRFRANLVYTGPNRFILRVSGYTSLA